MKTQILPALLWALLITIVTSVAAGVVFDGVPPIADAGSPRYAARASVVLDGTGSYDPDHSGALVYSWRQTAGPSVVITDAHTPIPTISGFVQTDAIQECEFELTVSDGELTSQPDAVKVVIVPDFGVSTLLLENPPFRPYKPTVIFFGGGDGILGGGVWDDAAWAEHANVIGFSLYEPDPGYTPGDIDSPRTYYGCGDMIIVYLSSVAPDYRQPIQTMGHSTGGQPAIDVGIHLNTAYADARYAVNHVTFLDATPYCRSYYADSISTFLASAVDGEQCWVDNYVTSDVGLPGFHASVLNVGSEVMNHWLAHHWYKASITGSAMNRFNHGVIAGAFWSVIGPGKNLQLGFTPDQETYKFKWYGELAYDPEDFSGYMDFYDEPNHPGSLPEPVTLVAPEDGAFVDANGAVFSCEESENAVGYQLLFGPDPHRVMDYHIVSDTANPPTDVVTVFPFEPTWWTVKVRDQYGSTIYADPICFHTAHFLLIDDFESYNDIDPPDPASNRIFDAWIDGVETPTTNGAMVGNELPPYAERTVVHAGEQSMPYAYDNDQKTSEATLTLAHPRNWTDEAVTTLSLWFKGEWANAAERMYVALNDSSPVYHGDENVTRRTRWTEWVIDVQAFADRGVDLSNVNTVTIGFGTKGSPAAGGLGKVYFDDIRLMKPVP